MKNIILIIILSLILISPPASAQIGKALDNLDKAVGTETGLERDLDNSIATVIKAALSILGTIFLLLTIYAGVLWMTAQGDSKQVDKAKDILKAAVIGLVVVLSAYAITVFVTTKLTDATTETVLE